MKSERRLLQQLAPELDEDMIRRLVAAFQDLRRGYDTGTLTYPYSLRGECIENACNVCVDKVLELINIIRHMRTYPNDPLETTLRNVFDFDVYKPETIDVLYDILDHHG